MKKVLIAAVMAGGLALAPEAHADDTDAMFIGEVSNFLPGKYIDGATVRSPIQDAHTACEMSDAGYGEEARRSMDQKWEFSDTLGFMAAATSVYCPQHLPEWRGI